MKIIIILLYIIMIFSCQKKVDVAVSKNIYLSTKIPYEIEDDSLRILHLPDSLRQTSDLNGLMVISIYVSDTQHIDGINLHILKIYNKDSSEIVSFINEYLFPFLFKNTLIPSNHM
ncbi:MAG: hypothetical protein IPF93_00230 [Saprospiraceae bacterium]|nr:hypothetical protein [Saprospiraceae bacterium]